MDLNVKMKAMTLAALFLLVSLLKMNFSNLYLSMMIGIYALRCCSTEELIDDEE